MPDPEPTPPLIDLRPGTSLPAESSSYDVSCLYYDLLSPPDRALSAADFLSAVAVECGATQVFDVGAGTGRVALALAERGKQITAAEPSRGMRIALLARLADRPDLQRRVTVLAAPALAARPARPVGLVHLGGVLPHVPAGNRPTLFRHLAGQLLPDGRLVLDMVATGLPMLTGPALLGERWLGEHVVRATRAVTAVDGAQLTARFRYQVLQGTQVVSEEVVDSDRESPLLEDVRRELSAAGLVIVQELGGFVGERRSGSDTLTLVARRR